jgi:adenine deaminase
VRLAVEAGVDPIAALVLATANPALYHGLSELGSLGPGYQADVCVFEDLRTFEPRLVFQAGRLVAEDGRVLSGVVPAPGAPDFFRRTVRLGAVVPASLVLSLDEGVAVRAIGVREGSLTTKDERIVLGDPGVEAAHLAVVERHRRTGRVGRGFVTGFGIRRGAIASSVGHDAHNCMVLGARGPKAGTEMAAALGRLGELGGGQVAVCDGRVLAEVPLPLAGLMSDQEASVVAAQLSTLESRVERELGVTLPAPFMHLSFLGLSVIPELRLSDLGLVDVGRFELASVVVDPA